MGIMDGFLQQLATGDRVHDYQHANKIFASDGFRSAPKHQFLFYVRIILNPKISQDTVYPSQRVMEVGSLCKTADLPKYTIENKQLNAYNRPAYATTKIKYQDLRITFHDDADNNIVDLWYNYYSYYFRDSDYGDSVYKDYDRYTIRQSGMWGFQPAALYESYQNLIQRIDLFSFHNNRFTQYMLINPRIQSWSHGSHDYAQGSGTMEHQVTFAYESVKYLKGYVTPDNFPDMMLRYDRTPSPLDPAGGGSVSILGRGGIVETANSVITDLAKGNWAGAALKVARASQTWKGAALNAVIKGEGIQLIKDIIGGKNPLSKISVPSLGSLTNSLSTGGVGGVAAMVSGAVGGAIQGFTSQTGALASLTKSSPVTGFGGGGSNILSAAQSAVGALTSNGGTVGSPPSSAITKLASDIASFPKNFGNLFG